MTTAYKYIEPTAVLGATANAIAIGYVNVQPFNSATVHYEVRHIQETTIPSPPDGVMVPGAPFIKTLMTNSITLTGDDYLGWGDDDAYLYAKVAEKNGLTLIPEPKSVQ